nr:sulfatase-like hydrolase/transferase [Candidatus Sigynarchaeota archaeon]
WRQYLWGYYRLVEHVDRIVGTILNALNSSQHARNTIVVFTADHGEGMAEHGWNQKQAFYDAVARVPFIISHPGSSIKGKSNRGLLVNSGVDVIPTLADLASVPLDNQKYKFPGKSIKDAVFEIDSAPPEHHVVSESEFGGFATNKWTHEDRAYGRMVRTPRFKYMAYSRGRVREFLVDMEADPGEMINLALDSRYTSELRRHRQLLKEWCIKTGDDFPVISE